MSPFHLLSIIDGAYASSPLMKHGPTVELGAAANNIWPSRAKKLHTSKPVPFKTNPAGGSLNQYLANRTIQDQSSWGQPQPIFGQSMEGKKLCTNKPTY